MKNLLEVEGNYFSTYAFVQQNNLENTSDKVLGKGWVAEDDVNQIQQIIDSLGIGNYSVGCIEGKSEDDIFVKKIQTLNYKAVRCEDCDYIENGKKIFYATLETEHEVVDYISFDSERDAFTFIEYYNYKN